MAYIDRDLKEIKQIIIHCSATDNPSLDNIESVRKMHTDKGWVDIGYHVFIDKRGRVFNGRPLDKVGAHCQGQNKNSIGICVSGNKQFEEAQFVALYGVIRRFIDQFGVSRKNILPHNFYNIHKTCPNFPLTKIWKYDEDTQLWYASKDKLLKGD